MTSEVTDTPGSGQPPHGGLAWHMLSAGQVLRSEGVDGQRGLSSAEAAARARRSGPNQLAAGRAESRWRAFVRQYRDPMQIVLLAAGVGSLYPLRQPGTGILLVLLTLFNAVMGLHQEGKAAAAAAALQKMMIITARVRQDGQLAEIPAGQLVPGDIVAIEAGHIVPADGRLLKAATLEVDESALTGESHPRPARCGPRRRARRPRHHEPPAPAARRKRARRRAVAADPPGRPRGRRGHPGHRPVGARHRASRQSMAFFALGTTQLAVALDPGPGPAPWPTR